MASMWGMSLSRLAVCSLALLVAYTLPAAADDAAVIDGYGPIPPSVENLLAVARFKVLCRRHGLREVSLQGSTVRFSPLELPESAQLRAERLYDKAHYKPAVSTLSVARPKDVRDVPLLAWCGEVLEAINPAAVSTPAAS